MAAAAGVAEHAGAGAAPHPPPGTRPRAREEARRHMMTRPAGWGAREAMMSIISQHQTGGSKDHHLLMSIASSTDRWPIDDEGNDRHASPPPAASFTVAAPSLPSACWLPKTFFVWGRRTALMHDDPFLPTAAPTATPPCLPACLPLFFVVSLLSLHNPHAHLSLRSPPEGNHCIHPQFSQSDHGGRRL